jgi:hypothetical protein
MSYLRTPEHRAMQSEAIRRWKPWEHSTGPKTEIGKRKSAMRGYKGGVRPKLREIGRALRERPEAVDSAPPE